jgi:hypothetical protein
MNRARARFALNARALNHLNLKQVFATTILPEFAFGNFSVCLNAVRFLLDIE